MGSRHQSICLRESTKRLQVGYFKLVEGRSIRRYRDEEEVIRKVKELGFNPFEEKLLGITAMSKLLGKKVFDENIGGLLEKPVGKLTLVSSEDRREEVKIDSVKEDFGGM